MNEVVTISNAQIQEYRMNVMVGEIGAIEQRLHPNLYANWQFIQARRVKRPAWERVECQKLMNIWIMG